MPFSHETLSGRYTVGERVSEGAAGEVYLGQDTELRRPVRIRVPTASVVAQPGFPERFSAGIDELVRIQHPGIACIQGRGEHDGTPYVVLQHPGGGSLSDRIRAAPEGRLAVADLLTWLPALAKALDFLHVQDVVHRDVQPANILFDEHDNPYLADPGLAALLLGNETGPNDSTRVAGSADYMAPELLAESTVSPASDVYALGVTLFQCLSGELPYPTGSPMSLAVKKNTTAPRPLADVVAGVPPDVAGVIMRAIARDPAKRHVTAKNLSVWLERAARGEASLPDARPVVMAEVVTPRVRRPEVVIAEPAANITVRAAASGRSARPRRPQTRAARSTPDQGPPTKTTGKRSLLKWGLVAVVLAGGGFTALWPQQAQSAFEEVRASVASLLGGAGPASDDDKPMEIVGFTFLRKETFAEGGAEHTVPIYRWDKGAQALGMEPSATAIDLEFVLVPGGIFTMGSPESETGHLEHEGPQRLVQIAPFLIARTEISQRVWNAVAAEAGTGPGDGGFISGDMYPVQMANWTQCAQWCRAAGLRLPSEAEWEYACRAGTTTPFSSGEDLPAERGNFHGHFPYKGTEPVLFRAKPVAVGALPPNGFGLHEMHGNVDEWCQDTYQEGGYRGAPMSGAAWVVTTNKERILRGGGCTYPAYTARSATRDKQLPDAWGATMRLTRSLVPEPTGAATPAAPVDPAPSSPAPSSPAPTDPSPTAPPPVDPVPALPKPDSPTIGGFTFLRHETFSAGGAEQAVSIYRSDALATAVGVGAGETAVDIEFVLVPAGTFTMGSPTDEVDRQDVEGPQHTVDMPSFLMARTETSQRVWDALVTKAHLVTNPSSSKGTLLPVDRITWAEAWNGARAVGLRLPTESEWEYACRAGTTTPFAFGANIDPSLVNYNGTLPYAGAAAGAFRGTPVDVGSLPPNAFGLHEMHGNVCEWCQDSWQYDLNQPPPGGEPSIVPWRLGRRVQRGGTWAKSAQEARSAQRNAPRVAAEVRDDNVGLRLARSLEMPAGAEEEKRAYLTAARIAYYPLQQDGKDVIGGNEAMSLSNTTFETPTSPPASAPALLLDGTGGVQYAATATVPSLRYESFSLAVEFQPLSFPADAAIVVGGISGRWLKYAWDADRKLTLTVNNGDRLKVFDEAVLEPGKLHILLSSVDVTNHRILTLLDGKLLEAASLPADFQINMVGTQWEQSDRCITFRNYAAREMFHGYVRNLRIYGRAMMEEELKALWFLLSPP